MDNRQKFENILDECLETLLTGNGTLEQCLQRYPEYAADLEPLLLTALGVDRAVDVTPSPEFKSRARYQMQLKMAESAAPRRTSFWSLQPKWALATMAILMVFLMSGGTVLAADGSMPGSALYPVKIAAENASLFLATDDYKKAELYTTLAERRVDEMVWVVENGKTAYIEVVAAKFEKVMQAMNMLAANLTAEPTLMLTAGNAESYGIAAAEDSKAATGEDTQLPQAAPPPASATTKAATGDNRNQAASTPTTEEATLVVTGAKAATGFTISAADKGKLKQYVAYNAIKHPEKLEKLLDKVPDELKPVITQMINDANASNTRILQVLDD